MEKVIIGGNKYDVESRVNEYLDKGWSVKNIHTIPEDDYLIYIFVLEKK